VPTYLEAESSPSNAQYLWAYRVTIENQGRETVQLLSRHWMITNSRGELTEVKGLGVIGKQPVLKPGESHAYTSGAPLNTPSGMMGGSYEMESDSGEALMLRYQRSRWTPKINVYCCVRELPKSDLLGPSRSEPHALQR
jgi:ApaG protein